MPMKTVKPWGRHRGLAHPGGDSDNTKTQVNMPNRCKPAMPPAALKGELDLLNAAPTQGEDGTQTDAKMPPVTDPDKLTRLREFQAYMQEHGDAEIANAIGEKIIALETPTPTQKDPTRRLFNQSAQFLKMCRDKVAAAEKEVERLRAGVREAEAVVASRLLEAEKAEKMKDKYFKKLCEEEDLERGVPASVRDAPALTATAALAQTLKLDPQAIAAKLAEQNTDNSSTETQADYPKIVEKALEIMLKAVTDAAKSQDSPQRPQRPGSTEVKRDADGKERERSRSPMRDAT